MDFVCLYVRTLRTTNLEMARISEYACYYFQLREDYTNQNPLMELSPSWEAANCGGIAPPFLTSARDEGY
jgi:hypothetical protein